MNLRTEVLKLKEQLVPRKELPILIIYSMSEITDIDAAIWVLFKL